MANEKQRRNRKVLYVGLGLGAFFTALAISNKARAASPGTGLPAPVPAPVPAGPARTITPTTYLDLLGRNVTGVIRGAVYEIAGVPAGTGEPDAGDITLKVIAYPPAPSAVGNSFLLQKTIDRYGDGHPTVTQVQALIDSVLATSLGASVNPWHNVSPAAIQALQARGSGPAPIYQQASQAGSRTLFLRLSPQAAANPSRTRLLLQRRGLRIGMLVGRSATAVVPYSITDGMVIGMPEVEGVQPNLHRAGPSPVGTPKYARHCQRIRMAPGYRCNPYTGKTEPIPGYQQPTQRRTYYDPLDRERADAALYQMEQEYEPLDIEDYEGGGWSFGEDDGFDGMNKIDWFKQGTWAVTVKRVDGDVPPPPKSGSWQRAAYDRGMWFEEHNPDRGWSFFGAATLASMGYRQQADGSYRKKQGELSSSVRRSGRGWEGTFYAHGRVGWADADASTPSGAARKLDKIVAGYGSPARAAAALRR